MKVKKYALMAAALAFLCTCGFAAVSIAADPGPAEMELKTSAGKKPAKFPHKAHQDKFACGDCHHSAADGKQVAYKDGDAIGKCESCHDGSLANAKVANYMKAAHENCKGCHKEKGGPTKCADCHPAAK